MDGLPSITPGPRPITELLDDNPVVGEPRRRGSGYLWNTAELRTLREHYPTRGVEGCLALLPGRSAGSIYNKANQLGIRTAKTGAGRAGKPRTRWTADQHIDRMIRERYPACKGRKDTTRLAQALMRPRWWINRRAVELGLAQLRFKEPAWSREETELLRSIAHLGLEAISRRLRAAGHRRTKTAIKVRLKRIEADTTDPNHYTATGLARLMGVDNHAITGWISRGLLKARRRGTERTAANGGDMWWISRADVRRFIVANVALVDIRKVEKHWFVELLSGANPGASP